MTLLGPKWDCISPLLFSLRWFPTALQGSPHLPISSAASLFSLSSSHTRLLSPICQAQSCLREFASAVPSALSFPHGLLPHFLQALAQMSFSEKDLGPLQVVGAPLPALFLFPASHQLALLVCFFSVSPLAMMSGKWNLISPDVIFVTNKNGLSINIYHCSVLVGMWRCQRQHPIKLLLVKSQVFFFNI